MAKTYTPNPNRRVVNGRADVSAEELADFKRKYGEDKTLRDLLNMDKGLKRRDNQSQSKTRVGQSGTDTGDETDRLMRRAPVRAGITEDLPSKISDGGMDDDRRASSRSSLYQNLTRAGLTPDSDTSLGSSLGAAATMAAPGIGRMAAGSRTARDVGMARAMSKDAASMPRSAATPAKDASRTTSETGQRFTPKEQVEAAESTVRGSVNRRNIQETRAAREKMEEEAKRKFMQEEKQSKPFKPGQREDSDVEFRRGGKVKSYANGGMVKGAGAAQRGVRPCKYV